MQRLAPTPTPGLALTPDLTLFLAAAADAADAAGAVIQPHFRGSVPADIKPDRSPVTVADRDAELVMREILRLHCPEHGILGEEFGLERPDARLRWVLDPIDGTRAFITGRPTFGTLIALLDGDNPLIGIIDQPVTGERWTGVAGQATTFTGPFGGKPGTRACKDLSKAELSCTSPEMLAEHMPRFETLKGRVRRNTWGGDCYAFGLLALGQIDVIVERDLKPWDWAALLSVIQGAGGAVTDWFGNPPRLDGDGRIIAVGDPALLAEIVPILTA